MADLGHACSWRGGIRPGRKVINEQYLHELRQLLQQQELTRRADSAVTRAMVCMRLAAAGLPEADLPEACSSGTPGTAPIPGEQPPKQDDQWAQGMVARRPRNTLLTDGMSPYLWVG